MLGDKILQINFCKNLVCIQEPLDLYDFWMMIIHY